MKGISCTIVRHEDKKLHSLLTLALRFDVYKCSIGDSLFHQLVQCFAFQFEIYYEVVIAAAFWFISYHHFTGVRGITKVPHPDEAVLDVNKVLRLVASKMSFTTEDKTKSHYRNRETCMSKFGGTGFIFDRSFANIELTSTSHRKNRLYMHLPTYLII